MATVKLIGSSTDGASSMYGNYVIYAKYIAEATGKVTEIKVYSVYFSGHAKVSIYADNAGEPGTKITGNDTSQAVTADQWNTLSIAETSVVKDTVYWVGICTDTMGVSSYNGNAGTIRYKAATFSSFIWPSSAGTGFSNLLYDMSLAGWGNTTLVISPSSISQPVAYGSPKLNLSIKPSSILQALAYGTPTVLTSALIIQPSSIVQPIVIGAPSLRYPQTISPSSIIVTIAYGTPSIGIFGIIAPQSIIQQISIGSPTILKYVWHVILDGQYNIESPEVNRTYVIGQDAYGNPVYGTADNATEGALVGERLDFQQELAIPLTAQAAGVAAAILSKLRMTTKKGLILIPPNCGQELFDVVQITDSGANQSAVKFRVVGLRFEYNIREAKYEHKLILGAP